MCAATRKFRPRILCDEYACTINFWWHFEGYIEFCCSGASFVDSDLSCRKKVFFGHARSVQANPGIYQGAPLNQATLRAGGCPCRSCSLVFSAAAFPVGRRCADDPSLQQHHRRRHGVSNPAGDAPPRATPPARERGRRGERVSSSCRTGSKNFCRLCKNDSTLLYRTTSDPQIQQQDPARHHQVSPSSGGLCPTTQCAAGLFFGVEPKLPSTDSSASWCGKDCADLRLVHARNWNWNKGRHTTGEHEQVPVFPRERIDWTDAAPLLLCSTSSPTRSDPTLTSLFPVHRSTARHLHPGSEESDGSVNDNSSPSCRPGEREGKRAT
jgi:hypothetical protein